MAAVDNIQTAITNVSALIAEITASPQPTYSIDGENVSWAEYLNTLTQQLEKLQEALVVLSGPYALVSQGVS